MPETTKQTSKKEKLKCKPRQFSSVAPQALMPENLTKKLLLLLLFCRSRGEVHSETFSDRSSSADKWQDIVDPRSPESTSKFLLHNTAGQTFTLLLIYPFIYSDCPLFMHLSIHSAVSFLWEYYGFSVCGRLWSLQSQGLFL